MPKTGRRSFVFSSSPLRSGAAMSDRLAAVNAAQDADEARLRRIEDRSIDSCQPGVVDYCVAMLEELRVIREAARLL